ncbi:MAG: queuosine precursor transporter [Candidatus Roseilinea sp.]|uniref:queuosine precursor transporter n=1 Tax=Candidatus Roseilinea sp. TaxID=2838777 RepID=UPI004049A293
MDALIRLVIVCSAYIAAQMMADITSLRIVTIAGLSMDAGTLIYPFTFTLRDLVHKVAGIKAARALIFSAAAINIFMALLFQVVAQLPPDPAVGPQVEFGMVLAPVWRIVFASIVAEVVAELVDTEVYQLWVTRVTTRYQWARVLTSNAVSVPLDSLLFAWLAFGGELPAEVVWAIVLSNIVVKGATTLVSLPGIYLVRESAPPKLSTTPGK